MSTPDFFRSRLDQMIDLRHPLAMFHADAVGLDQSCGGALGMARP